MNMYDVLLAKKLSGGGGGGGSSDFSTTNVTLKSITGNAEMFWVPAICDIPEIGPSLVPFVQPDASSGYEIQFDAVLYKGMVEGWPDSYGVKVLTEGDISAEESGGDTLVTIRGDGKITIAPNEN